MKKTVVTFGLMSGAVSSALMLATVPFIDQIGFDRGAIFGYSAMVLSFLLVFFGIRSYRDQVGAGSLTFGRGVAVGILITAISCVCYVITWEIVYFNFMPDFGDKYASYAVARVKAAGASQQTIDATVQQMKDFKQMYDNPFINAAMTFLEPLPVGLVMTLVSAATLRRKPSASARDRS